MEGEVFLLVVESLHCSGCFLAYKGVHFPVREEDHRTGLALWLTLIRCQGSCGIVPTGLTVCILRYASGLEVLACSIDTDLNYDGI